MKTLKEFRQKYFTDPKAKAEYDRLKSEYDLISQLIKKRIKKGMSQSDVAKKLGTKQASISRIESGSHSTSFQRYSQYADAVGSNLKVTLN